MSQIKIAAVKRAGVYSPNHIGNDTAILNVVAEQLRKRGCEVSLYSEDELAAGKVDESIVVNMCREPRSIALLQQFEDEGRIVINSGFGIENCLRERMTRILVGNNIPFPESIIVNTDEAVRARLVKGGFQRCWIKRADSHTMHKEDVTIVRHPVEAQEVLQEYFLRGIKRAVISRHIEGRLIKFYGIAGTPFFEWLFPHSDGLSDTPVLTKNDEDRLRNICSKAAEALDVRIFGGDCIITPEGDLIIVHINDWPSFAPCRTEAATSIAKAVMAEIKARQ
ncbi:MAG: hypothetical protein K2H50_04855 [Paramuribaculum sp.]|nr:hypothetical protein [Paramuribaculum sp.]MDE5836314.1 hypothetical protein [Paramuribaculum sp.]